MKDIRIFIASSKELERERNYLAFLVLAKEDEFAARGLRVRLAKWEYVDPKMTSARTEDRYLDEMYNCDAVLILFRDVAGMYTREELNKALAREQEGVSRLKVHQILFSADGKPDSDAAKLRKSLPLDSYGIWYGMNELNRVFLSLVDRVAQCEGLVDALSDKDVRKITAFLAVDDELAEERNAFADTVLNVNDLLEQTHRNIRVQLKFYDPANVGAVIESSEMGLVLYGTNYRMFGSEEIKRIYERVKDGTQNPKRFYVFFRNLNETEEKSLDDEFKTFRSDFVSRLGHFTCQFGDTNALRLGFLLSLERYVGESIEIYSTVSVPTTTIFVGRENELRRLCELLEPVPGKFPVGRLPVITGAGGTGKSELVRQYASQVRVQYPGGVFQVDMENAKTWDEAFLGILRGLPNNGISVEECLGLKKEVDEEKETDSSKETPKEPMTGVKVRDALLRRAREHGPILLVLDNVESSKALFGRDGGFTKAFPAGFSERVIINVVATARVCEYIPQEDDWIVKFPLDDLGPDAAVELLGKIRAIPSSGPEKDAAVRIAKGLGFRAHYLCRVVGMLAKGEYYESLSYVEFEKLLKDRYLSLVDEGQMGDEAVDRRPVVLWEMTRQALLHCWRSAMVPQAPRINGKEYVKLAQVASFFSPDGFPKHILRHLWNTVVASDVTSDEHEFNTALDVLRRHNIFQSSDPVRIHRLDRVAILQTAKTEPGLEETVGKALAAYEGMSPKDWLLLADNVGILRFMSEEVRSFKEWSVSIQTTLLCKNPAFQRECQWEKMEVCDWMVLLVALPQFAGRCPWDKLNGGNWANLLDEQPQFADRCQWEKLNGWDWASLLKRKPQFANECPWGKLDGKAWVELLDKQPQFADCCKWEILDGRDWASLLETKPQFADRCPWEKLDEGSMWSNLLSCQPQFSDHCPWDKLDGRDWASLLETKPQFADRCPWDKLDGGDWASLLCGKPQFANKCPWEKINWVWWGELLGRQPQFVDYCPSDIIHHPQMWVDILCRHPQSRLVDFCPWMKFGRGDWAALLSEQPQFMDRCPLEILDGEDWAWVLAAQPQFADHCPWEKLNGKDWDSLLSEQPQFAHYCQWDKLDGRNWASLLAAKPQFADKCPWEKFDGVDWVYLLCDQPQFIDRCCRAGSILELPGWVLASMLCWEQRLGFDGCFRDFSDELVWIDLEGLINSQPKIAEHFPWKNLDGGDWAWLLCKKPQFADHCPWEKLNEDNWALLLKKCPQFVDRRHLKAKDNTMEDRND